MSAARLARARSAVVRLAVATALSACAARGPDAPAVSVVDLGDVPGRSKPTRAPDSVALDPPPALPTPVSRAESGGVVALRVPVSREAIASFLHAFFAAWQNESIDDLVAMLAPDAGPIEARSRGPRVLVEEWRQRMRAHEYGRLAGAQMVQPDRIERWEPDELGVEGAPARVEARPGEIVVRAPIDFPSIGGERLFGDSVVVVLRADEGTLRIAAYGEVEAR